MERIGVKTHRIRNLYVLVVYRPGSRRKIATRRQSRRPFAVEAGAVVRIGSRKLRILAVERHLERRDGVIEHVTDAYTETVPRRRGRRSAIAPNVVAMPAGDHSVVAEFLRYHVLVRVFGGDPDAMLAHLREHGGRDGDVRFVRWIRTRLRHDPALLATIRRMVDATPFWRAAEA